MKRFLMLVAVATVAGAMYVAAAPGSQQSKGPTARQFAALSKKVTALAKQEKTTNQHLDELLIAYVHCSLHSEIGISQRGDTSGTNGYEFSANGAPVSPTTALDLDTSGSPTYVVTPFNSADSNCQGLVGLVLRHRGSLFGQKFALKP